MATRPPRSRARTLWIRALALMRSRWWVLVPVGLALLLFSPVLNAGFFGDDFVFLLTHLGKPPCDCTPLDVYRYSTGNPELVRGMVESGIFPWWTDPAFKVALWRPLTSLTFLIDYRIGQGSPGVFHVTSLLWFVAFLFAMNAVLRASLPRHVAGLALLLFAVDLSHWMTVSWAANRHAIIAGALGLLGMGLYLRARTRRQVLPLVGFGLCTAASLAGGETGLQPLLFLLAYELLGRREPLRTRLAWMGGICALALVYLGIYRARGYGAFAAGSWVDPLREPLRFVDRVARVAPSMAAELLGGTEILYLFEHPPFWGWVLITVTVLAFFAFLLRSAAAARPLLFRRAGWWMGGALLAIWPPIAGQRDVFGTSRSLLFSSVGAAVVLAVIIFSGLGVLAARRHRLGARGGKVFAAGGILVAMLTLLVEPVLLRGTVGEYAAGQRELLDIAAATGKDEPDSTQFVVVTHAGYLTGYAPYMRYWATRRGSPSWWSLSWSARPLKLTRVAPQVVALETETGSILDHDFEQFYRSPGRPLFREGDVVDTAIMRVKVQRVDELGRPLRIEATFFRPLEDGGVRFLGWKAGTFLPLDLPAVGKSLRLTPDDSYLEG